MALFSPKFKKMSRHKNVLLRLKEIEVTPKRVKFLNKIREEKERKLYKEMLRSTMGK